MTNLIIKLFTNKDSSRESYGKMAGVVGIITNFVLFLVKLFVGLFTSSISIMTDAINNLSDSTSSLITIIGFKMASKPADDDHPYGHARFEYISGLLVACIIFIIGIQFLISSVKKTLHPEPIEFGWIVLALLLLSILVKLWQSAFNKKVSKIINSEVLKATSVDSRNDAIVTLVVLVALVIEFLTGFKIDGIMGLIVSIFVIYSGFELLKDTLDPLLGMAPSADKLELIERKIEEYPQVIGMHDLMVHNYGPGKIYASAHVEMSASQDIMESHEIIDEIERDFYTDLGIDLVIHLDPVDVSDPELKALQEQIECFTKKIDSCLSIHDFRIVRNKTYTRLIFDVTVPSLCGISNNILRQEYKKYVSEINDSYEAVVTIDRQNVSNIAGF